MAQIAIITPDLYLKPIEVEPVLTYIWPWKCEKIKLLLGDQNDR